MIFVAVAELEAVQSRTASPSAAATDSAANNYSKEAWVVEKLSSDIVFQADGTGRREQAVIVRVQSAEGVRQFGVLTIPYDAGLEKVEQVEVRVRKPDGTIITTPELNIQDLPTEVSRIAPMYSDLREKQVPVKSLGTGDVLEYRILWVRTKTEIPGQFWYSQSFTKEGVVLEETLRIDLPAEKYVQVLSPESAPTITESGGRKVYFWKHSQLESVKQSQKPQPKRQRPVTVRPSVQLTTFHDWDELGRWFGALVAQQAVLTPAVQAKAAELTRGLTTDSDKQNAIYNCVATKFRYISVSFGAGRYRPHTAEEVLTNQYGDCKDKHTLFAALLKAAGFTAWPALINAGVKLDPELPSPDQFNHVISVLPEGKDVVWLDTTPEVAPWGALMPLIRDQQSLVIPDNGPAHLATTPADLPFRRIESLEVKGDLSNDGTFTGHIESSFHGDSEIVLRSAFRQTAPAKWQELMQNISYGMGFAGTVTNVEVDELEDTHKPFHCSWDYERKKYPDWENHRITAPLPGLVFPFGPGDIKPDEPIDMGSPGEIVYHATVRLPKGYSAQLPENVKVENVYGVYTATFDNKDGAIIVERRLTASKSKIPTSAWDDYLALEKSVRTDGERWIQFSSSNPSELPLMSPSDSRSAELVQQGWQALQNRNLNVARDALEQAERVNAKEPGVQASMGLLFLMENRREKGYERLRREIANNPGNQAAYHLLADALLREFRHEEGLETLRSLLQIAPTDLPAVSQFANLLISDKRYMEALPAVETALKSRPDDVGLQVIQMRILLNSGRREDGVAIARKLGDHAADVMTLNDVASFLVESNVELPLARQYSEKAVLGLEGELADVRLSALTNDDLRRVGALATAWDTLGWLYFRAGEIPSAEARLNAAWMLAQKGGFADHLAQLYERQDKRSAAIHMYKLALAASPGMDEARERLGKLDTAPKPATTVLNGKPTRPVIQMSPGEELGKLRTTNIPELGQRTGSAEFFVLMSAHKVEDVQFISGSDSLKDAGSVLLKARYNALFPDDGPERLARRGILSCSGYTTPNCSFVFLLPENARK